MVLARPCRLLSPFLFHAIVDLVGRAIAHDASTASKSHGLVTAIWTVRRCSRQRLLTMRGAPECFELNNVSREARPRSIGTSRMRVRQASYSLQPSRPPTTREKRFCCPSRVAGQRRWALMRGFAAGCHAS